MSGRPSAAGYWLGALAIVAGVVLAAVAVVRGVVGFTDRIDDFERVPVPGEATVSLDEGGHTLFFEIAGLGSDENVPVPALDVQIVPVGGGGALAIGTYDSELTYTTGGRSAVAVATVDVPADGEYVMTVRVAGEPSAAGRATSLAVGRGLGGGLVAGVAFAALAFFGGLVVGGIVIGVTAVRRSRARAVPPPAWPPPPPPGWAPPGGSGWAPPPPGPGWAPPPAGPGWAPPPAGSGSPPPSPGSGWAPPPAGSGSPPAGSGWAPPSGWAPQPPPGQAAPGPPPPPQR